MGPCGRASRRAPTEERRLQGRSGVGMSGRAVDLERGEPTVRRRLRNAIPLAVLGLALSLAAPAAFAKDTVKVGFIGPLTGGVSANGLGGRNSADLAVRLRNQDANAKY